MENENVVDANLNTSEETVLETVLPDDSEQDTTDWKAEAEKAKEIANNQRIRAEKAEKLAKQTPKEDAKQVNLSTSDIIALTRANINEDDINEVQEYAKFKGISIKDALNSSVVKTLLSDNAEKRNVASATNTSNVKRGPAQASDDVLLARASKGEMPSNDSDLIRLIKARKGLK